MQLQAINAFIVYQANKNVCTQLIPEVATEVVIRRYGEGQQNFYAEII